MINTKDLIGRHKYMAFKNFKFEEMNEKQMVEFRKRFKISVAEAEKQIKEYEKYKNKESNTKANQEYFKNLSKIAKVDEIKITKESLWSSFKRNFKELTKKDFIQNKEVVENLKPLFYYFTGDFENFKNSKALTNLTEPSFEKGLLIVGDFGNGKSTSMNVIEKCLRNTPLSFKGFTTNFCVSTYEGSKTNEDADLFFKDLCRGRRYFDDLKTERQVTYYGRKFQLFKDVLEIRDAENLITHATINYKKGFEGDVQEAIKEIGELYGDRLNDRIYKMFNIIEFKGKSFRK